MAKTDSYIVILAGGGGTRLWPKSRQTKPKQFLKLIGKRTLFQETIARVEGHYLISNIFVVTNQTSVAEIRKQAPKILKENILVEPLPKGTTAAVGLAASVISKKDPRAVISTLAADHYITDGKSFLNILSASQVAASKGNFLVTIGIRPTHPHTGLGYIRAGKELFDINGVKVYKVEEFTEKPEERKAKRYFASGEYFWNANINSYQAKTLLLAVRRHTPSLYQALQRLPLAKSEKEKSDLWDSFPDEPIDTAILEKADNVLMVPGEFSWFDIGDWSAVHSIIGEAENVNVVVGDADPLHLGIDTEGCLVHGSGRLIATIGLKDLVIVDTPDVLLICPKSRAQEVKKIVERLQKEQKSLYL